VTRSGTCL